MSLIRQKRTKGNYKNGVQDLFSVVLILKIMFERQDFNSFYQYLIKNVQELNKSIHTINFDKILDRMGFPKNYKKLLNL